MSLLKSCLERGECVSNLKKLFRSELPIIAVVHLMPLPGAPRYEGMSVNDIADLAAEEAVTLTDNGVSGIIVENFRDMMFLKQVRPETVASMTYVADKVKRAVNVPVGLCVLQSDPIAALAICKAIGGDFIRAPYYTETYVVDTGLMESSAADALRYRSAIHARNVKIFADVHIKHGYPLSQRSIEESAEDALERGLADAIIITGKKTGGKTDPRDVASVKRHLPESEVIVGSGVTEENLHEYFPEHADAVIVGTSLKKDGRTEEKIDQKRVREFVAATTRIVERRKSK